MKLYVVQKNDTVEEIARKHGMSAEAFHKMNPSLKEEQLRQGMKVKVAVGKQPLKRTEREVRKSPAAGQQTGQNDPIGGKSQNKVSGTGSVGDDSKKDVAKKSDVQTALKARIETAPEKETVAEAGNPVAGTSDFSKVFYPKTHLEADMNSVNPLAGWNGANAYAPSSAGNPADVQSPSAAGSGANPMSPWGGWNGANAYAPSSSGNPANVQSPSAAESGANPMSPWGGWNGANVYAPSSSGNPADVQSPSAAGSGANPMSPWGGWDGANVYAPSSSGNPADVQSPSAAGSGANPMSPWGGWNGANAYAPSSSGNPADVQSPSAAESGANPMSPWGGWNGANAYAPSSSGNPANVQSPSAAESGANSMSPWGGWDGANAYAPSSSDNPANVQSPDMTALSAEQNLSNKGKTAGWSDHQSPAGHYPFLSPGAIQLDQPFSPATAPGNHKAKGSASSPWMNASSAPAGHAPYVPNDSFDTVQAGAVPKSMPSHFSAYPSVQGKSSKQPVSGTTPAEHPCGCGGQQNHTPNLVSSYYGGHMPPQHIPYSALNVKKPPVYPSSMEQAGKPSSPGKKN